MSTGGVVMVAVMLVAVPVAIMLAGALWSAVAGCLFTDEAQRREASS